jgi:hypothetical protein
MATRDLIGQAKGILEAIQNHWQPGILAFSLLIRVSQHSTVNAATRRPFPLPPKN